MLAYNHESGGDFLRVRDYSSHDSSKSCDDRRDQSGREGEGSKVRFPLFFPSLFYYCNMVFRLILLVRLLLALVLVSPVALAMKRPASALSASTDAISGDPALSAAFSGSSQFQSVCEWFAVSESYMDESHPYHEICRLISMGRYMDALETSSAVCDIDFFRRVYECRPMTNTVEILKITKVSVDRDCRDVLHFLLQYHRELVLNGVPEFRPLVRALECGNVDLALHWMELGASADRLVRRTIPATQHFAFFKNIPEALRRWETPLAVAARKNQSAVVERMLRMGVHRSELDHVAVWEATSHGNLHVLDLLLGPSPTSLLLSCALVIGCGAGHIKVVELLLKRGADVHSYDDHCVRKTARTGNILLMALLLRNGADLHARNDDALIGAIRNKDDSFFLLWLLQKGVDMRAQNDYLAHAVATHGRLDTLVVMVKLGFDFRVNNDLILRLAVQHSQISIVRFVLEERIRVRISPSFAGMPSANIHVNHNEPLIQAVIKEDAVMVAYLRSQGALEGSAS